ncbi:MAG: SAM-dependent methyltransferase [Oscillospiraceae bacterium]|nr:SAM-dependent methyltransferase [Oscillospiraceae bacterium]
MSIDKRLAVCADMVTGGFAADIGTDHGYLPSFLIRSGRCRHAIAADINSAPLDAARRTAQAEGTADRMTFILSDGLARIPLDDVTDIICAGMGGELIARIILEDERTKGISIITQPMSRPHILRHELLSHGYSLDEERAVISKGHIYSVMRWHYTGETSFDERDEYIGRLDPERETDRQYILDLIQRMTAAACGMADSRPHEAERLRRIIRDIGGTDIIP